MSLLDVVVGRLKLVVLDEPLQLLLSEGSSLRKSSLHQEVRIDVDSAAVRSNVTNRMIGKRKRWK